MGVGFGKWIVKGNKKKVSETITSVKGKYNVGSADKIKKKSNVKKFTKLLLKLKESTILVRLTRLNLKRLNQN